MGEMSRSLSVQIAAGLDNDEAELDRLSRQLRHELLELDVDSVARAPGEHEPTLAKSSGTSLVDVLIVSVSNSTVLVAMIQLLRGWMRRGKGRRVAIKIGKNTITINDTSAEEQARLIESWIDWHKTY